MISTKELWSNWEIVAKDKKPSILKDPQYDAENVVTSYLDWVERRYKELGKVSEEVEKYTSISDKLQFLWQVLDHLPPVDLLLLNQTEKTYKGPGIMLSDLIAKYVSVFEASEDKLSVNNWDPADFDSFLTKIFSKLAGRIPNEDALGPSVQHLTRQLLNWGNKDLLKAADLSSADGSNREYVDFATVQLYLKGALYLKGKRAKELERVKKWVEEQNINLEDITPESDHFRTILDIMDADFKL